MLDILTMTDAATPSGNTPPGTTSSINTGTSPSEATNTGAVIGGTTAGVITLMMLVILLLGCLVYNKRRKEMEHSGLHERYVKFVCSPFMAFQVTKDTHTK